MQMSHPSRKSRQPVGVLPYRLPPLSGLYYLRYSPPLPADLTDQTPSTLNEDEAAKTINLMEHVANSKSTAAASMDVSRVSTLSAGESHRRLHEQIMNATSLEDGTVDLFALYSACTAEPLPCGHCTLHIDTTAQTSSYRLRETFTLPPPTQATDGAANLASTANLSSSPTSSVEKAASLLAQLQRGWYAFFFPVSECGRLKDNLLVCVNDALIAGDVAVCDFEQGGVLRPLPSQRPTKPSSRSPAPFGVPRGPTAAPDGIRTGTSHSDTLPSSTHRKPLFYYVVSPVPIHDGRQSAKGQAAPTEVTVSVSWRSYPAAQLSLSGKKKTSFTLLYSYYCAPRAPDVLTCRAQFRADTRLRLVRSPNCHGAVQLKSEVSEHAAKLRVMTLDEAPLEAHREPKDYTFQICFYFGDYTGLLEETSWFAALIVVAVFLILLWFFLTKDLVV